MNFKTIKKIFYFLNPFCIALIVFSYPVFSEPVFKSFKPDFLILDSYFYNNQLWVVGEHGYILSFDDAEKWKVTQSSNNRLLTSITSNHKATLMAAGHDATIVVSSDSGKSWEVMYTNPELEQAIFDIEFIDDNYALAIGSYGLYLLSHDAGKTWTQSDINLNDSEQLQEDEIGFSELHFNAISINKKNDYCAIAAEAGVVYISNNHCQTWDVIQSPYEGSFFGVEFIDDQSIVFYGLRGNVFIFNGLTQQWKRLESGTNETLHSSFSDGESIFIVGYGSTVLELNKNTLKIQPKNTALKRNYTSIIQFNKEYYLGSNKGFELLK